MYREWKLFFYLKIKKPPGCAFNFFFSQERGGHLNIPAAAKTCSRLERRKHRGGCQFQLVSFKLVSIAFSGIKCWEVKAAGWVFSIPHPGWGVAVFPKHLLASRNQHQPSLAGQLLAGQLVSSDQNGLIVTQRAAILKRQSMRQWRLAAHKRRFKVIFMDLNLRFVTSAADM